MDLVNIQQIKKIKTKIQQFITLPKTNQPNNKSNQRYMSPSRRSNQFNNFRSKSGKLQSPKKNNLKSPKKKGVKILMKHPHDRSNKSRKEIQLERKQKSLIILSKKWKTQDSHVFELMNSEEVTLRKRQEPKQKQIKIQEEYNSKVQSDVFSFDQSHTLIKEVYKAVPQIIPKTLNNKKNQNNFVVQKQEQTVKPSSLFNKANFNNNNFLSNNASQKAINKQVKQKQKEQNSRSITKDFKRQKSEQNFYENSNINRNRNLRQSVTSQLKTKTQNNQENRNKSLSWNQLKKQQKAKKEKKLNMTSIVLGNNHQQSSKKLSQSQYSSNFKSKKSYYNYKSPVIQQKNNQISLSPQQRLKYKTTRQTAYLINKFSSKLVQKENFKSPNQKHENLAKKYSNLDKRLSNLLQKVRQQKKIQTPSTQNLQNKTQIYDEVLIYQKFSPLKKLLKVNKELRLKFQENQKDRLYFQ